MGAYKFQLADARQQPAIRNVAGKCSDTSEFAGLVNRAIRKLWKRGAWWGTEVVMKLCVHGCHVVWPRYVGTIEGLRFCGSGQAEVKNGWYAILGPRTGMGFRYGEGWSCDVVAHDDGTTPTFNEITGNAGKFLRYHVVKQQDLNRNITFYGKQYGGQPLQEQVNSHWQNGITLTSATPIAQTTTLVTKLTQVVREPTEGMTYLYQYDPTTTDLLMLAQYEPNETNPQYRRSKINNLCNAKCTTDANGQKTWQVEAMVKLEFIEATSDLDFLIIDDWDALAFAIQSIKFGEANDPQNAEIYLLKAISELNFESRNKDIAQEFVTKVRVMGSNRIISNPV